MVLEVGSLSTIKTENECQQHKQYTQNYIIIHLFTGKKNRLIRS